MAAVPHRTTGKLAAKPEDGVGPGRPHLRNGKREDVHWTYGYQPIDDPLAPTGVGGVLVLRGAEHRFELANPAYKRLVGERDVVGKTVAEALPEAM